MGRVYGAITGWEVDDILHKKYIHYGLDESFIYFRPGSDSALTSAITGGPMKEAKLLRHTIGNLHG